MDRALREFRIRGVATNLVFLENLISHPKFLDNSYTTKFIDETPALFDQPRRKDRATKLLQFIGDVVVNGNAEVRDRTCPDLADIPHPAVPKTRYVADLPQGAKAILDAQGAKAVADWMLAQPQALLTDTTMRDAHQSLLATRMRSKDMVDIASTYSQHLPQLFSVECWGGATFDVAMRFLKEDPWQRLAQLRAAMPNMLLQMLLRASNGVGYTNYPDNVVRDFVHKAAAGGIDVFRVFDANNWSENMVVAMQAVQETGKICEAAMCYTGDMLNPDRPKYNLDYYLKMAAELAAAGAHIIGIKDMAGLAKPAAISQLVQAVKAETGLPIHFHTHDTSGIAASSVLAAIAAGADAVDAAFDSMSGLTSQPNLGSIAEALRFTDKNPGLDPTALRQVAEYWEHVRKLYSPFESNIRCGTSDVYRHEMPGGQYTNLRQQARSLGIEDRWDDVATAYADVNAMFGDIVKVTPTSKVVGDMALMMVTSGLCPQDVCDPATEISFPESVVQFFHGDLGQPPGGFPAALQRKVLKGEAGLTVRPGTVLPAVDLAAEKAALAATLAEDISDFDLAAYLMYPSVFKDFAAFRAQYGDVSVLPTRTFFYGMERGEEITVDIEQGKTLVIRMLAVGDPDDEGRRTVFFELNGQPRTVKVDDGHLAASAPKHPKADAQNPAHVAAPMPGLITAIQVQVGDRVVQGDALFTMEAMKMETTVTAERAGTIATCVVPVGTQVDAKDLVLIFEPHTM
jgi:pyruvate carboxylase